MDLRGVDRILVKRLAAEEVIISAEKKDPGGTLKGEVAPCLGDSDIRFDKPAVIAEVHYLVVIILTKKLWSTSMHGLALQPYTSLFAADHLTAQEDTLLVEQAEYPADIGKGVVVETDGSGSRSYPMVHVLGGKNVYYFLTPLENRKLQTLPVAYDVNSRQWFDMAASGVRHFPGGGEESPVSW